jgi:hypothetical protein
VAQPEVLDGPAATAGFGAIQRAMMGRLGIRHALRLHYQS